MVKMIKTVTSVIARPVTKVSTVKTVSLTTPVLDWYWNVFVVSFIWNIESIFIGIDHCQPNPCFNGSKCLSKQNHYECECRPGFDGPQCRHGKSCCHPIVVRWVFKFDPYKTEGLNNHGSWDRGRTLFMDLRFWWIGRPQPRFGRYTLHYRGIHIRLYLYNNF